MKRMRTMIVFLLLPLVLGVVTATLLASPRAALALVTDTSTTSVPTTTDTTATTTDPTPVTTETTAATTAQTTTNTPTTDTPTTDPSPTTTAASTTATGGQTGANSTDSSQGSDQTNVSSPRSNGGSGTNGGSSSCSTHSLDCGNNAATQIAIVSQTCTNTAQVDVKVEDASGALQGNYTINPQTCLNVANITQIVQQFCVNCTMIIVPPPPPPTAAPGAASKPPAPKPRGFYCAAAPVLRADGTIGEFLDLEAGEPSWNPRWKDVTPALFDPGRGYYCAADGPPPLSPAVFTLTVPAAFVGQTVQLCIQPQLASLKPTCNAVRIDQGATIAVPVTSNVAATVQLGDGTQTTVNPNASRAALAAASTKLSRLVKSDRCVRSSKPARKLRLGAPHRICKKGTK